ncbi:MAG TPA: AAA family ATPase [Candidatus Nitrosocosmicus sp.]|nr:AAA family ATPase [Candidatus Nitrosocosmicus sp.]
MNNYSSIPTSENTNHSASAEAQALHALLDKANLPTGLREKANMQIDRIELALKFGGNFNQLEIVSKYIDWISKLPWNTRTEDQLDIVAAKKMMDQNHYGLEDIKRRILEYLSVLILQKQNLKTDTLHAPILFFVGLAGTGKTTFAKSIADTLARKFIRIPFGGLSSALDLRGLSKIQPEAEPGQVLKSLAKAYSKNPVILLDELDRVTPEARSAIMGVLIELLDPEQNANFLDHYIDYPFDLSQVIFVATANNTNNISTAVLDRLEVIQMPSYKDDEKIVIAKQYILPKLLQVSGMKTENLTIDDIVWEKIARLSGYDPGIRSVERYVETIVRKVAYQYVNKEATKFVINEENSRKYLE